jgi:HK97 family phage portal protein
VKPVNLAGVNVRSIENPSVPLSSAYGAALGAPSTAGVSISEMRAMQLTTVYACVDIIAGAIGSLPGKTYRVKKSGAREVVNDKRPEHNLIFRAPNELMSSFSWRETVTAYTLLWGNGHSAMEVTGAGTPSALLPLFPWNVTPEVKNRKLYFKSEFPGGKETLPADRVLHIPGLSFDGVTGMAPIRHLRNALGLAMAAEEYGARFFANDARPGVILEVPGMLAADAQRELKQSMEEKHAGLGNKWRVMVAQMGMKVHEVGIPPTDAQFLETRKFQVGEIANIFHVPLPLLNAMDKSVSYGSVEQFQIQFVTHTLRKWLVRWETELNRKLFPAGNYCMEFDVTDLLRGDFVTRMNGYRIAVGRPFMAPNEARMREGMEPDPDPEMDKVGQPLNMGNPGGDADTTGKKTAPKAPTTEQPEDE